MPPQIGRFVNREAREILRDMGLDVEGLPSMLDDGVNVRRNTQTMEQEERVRKSQEMYAQAGAEYERVLFNAENGGFVLVHQGHNRGESYESELFVARVLANQGRRVTLLNETGMGTGVVTPDADIDGNLAEFKRVTDRTKKVANRIQQGFLGAKKQNANVVVFHIDRQQSEINSINRGIAQAVIFDDSRRIELIIMVFRDGTSSLIDREEWNNGKRF